MIVTDTVPTTKQQATDTYKAHHSKYLVLIYYFFLLLTHVHFSPACSCNIFGLPYIFQRRRSPPSFPSFPPPPAVHFASPSTLYSFFLFLFASVSCCATSLVHPPSSRCAWAKFAFRRSSFSTCVCMCWRCVVVVWFLCEKMKRERAGWFHLPQACANTNKG